MHWLWRTCLVCSWKIDEILVCLLPYKFPFWRKCSTTYEWPWACETWYWKFRVVLKILPMEDRGVFIRIRTRAWPWDQYRPIKIRWKFSLLRVKSSYTSRTWVETAEQNKAHNNRSHNKRQISGIPPLETILQTIPEPWDNEPPLKIPASSLSLK